MIKIQQEKANSEQNSEGTINHYALASMAAGLVPIPIFDLVTLTAVQLKMVHSLADQYDVKFSDDFGKTIISALLNSILSVSFSPIIGSLLKAIPIIGQTTSALTMPAINGAATFATGKVFKRHFASGGTMENFEPEKAKEYFKEQFEEGKKVVNEYRKKRFFGGYKQLKAARKDGLKEKRIRRIMIKHDAENE
ncbi:MAG TPA: DUF697 domain-containing protein [Thermodesulfovibrionia bacterium]|nr:DUF697 domain-containing protein [Thermodesulfovibrionia bacterium]